MKPNETAIDRVIRYSLFLRDVRLTLLQLRKTAFMIRRLDLPTIPFNNLLDVEASLKRTEIEINTKCKLLLEPILRGIDFGHNRLNQWWLSTPEIEKGYCELEQILKYDTNNKPIMFGKQYILLLYDYTDSTLGLFYRGELIPYTTAIHFINNIPKKKVKIDSLYKVLMQTIETAIKHRSIKYLKND